ncbi:hypothetical protein KUL17_33450 [Alteromonas sp. KUL17]|uniref:hypothetical protein n=1 Tax=Alteromonas sp. KUL17 TaxID=2480796 RepID=UPI0010FFB2C5|nr:hypothetical protein [Alteromonas sp. KUL17]GEA04448.1 hypothetical protein KUL17_33450 [Alteromonas sp. KUL17]
MEVLSVKELDAVAGGGAVGEIMSSIGYGAGYAAGYFYSNVMTSNRWLDDLAKQIAL